MKYIGVYDSGIGGLTVVKAIHKSLKNENIVFLADSKNMPYGCKTNNQIIEYSLNNMKILSEYDLKAAVIACNTSDSLAKNKITKKYNIPIIGVIDSTVKKAIKTTKNKKIGLIATSATCKSKAYEKLINKYDNKIKVFTSPCPDLASLIESQNNKQNKQLLTQSLIKYIKPLIDKKIDTLILGCTHYHLLKNKIKKMYPDLMIVSSSACVVSQLKKTLKDNNLLSKSHGRNIYLTTKYSKVFNDNASKIIPNIKFKEK